jgi:single-strand DNA-binding protein
MNSVALIGNLTRDPEVRYTSGDMAIATFSIAINRPPKKDGSDGGADFPRITVFGKQAENVERFLKRGSKVGITGRIQTGSYEKDGHRIYTTDIVADRVEFLGRPSEQTESTPAHHPAPQPIKNDNSAWAAVNDDDIPF